MTISLRSKKRSDKGLKNQTATRLNDSTELGRYHSQQVQIDPPLKRYWGLVSVALVMLVLGGTILCSPTKKGNTQAETNMAGQAAGTPMINVEPGHKPPIAPTIVEVSGNTSRFLLLGYEDRFVADKARVGERTITLDPPLGDYFASLAYQEGLSARSDIDSILLKTIPLAGESNDGRTELQGALTIWMSEDKIIWDVTLEIAPTYPERSQFIPPPPPMR